MLGVVVGRVRRQGGDQGDSKAGEAYGIAVPREGVATSAGVFLALAPVPTLIALGVFLTFFLSTGHVSFPPAS